MSSLQDIFDYEEHLDKENGGSKLIATVTFGFVISYASIALRIASRRLNRIAFGTDDWLMFLSLVSGMTDCVAVLLTFLALAQFFTSSLMSIIAALTTLGLGKHIVFLKSCKAFSVLFMTGELLYVLIIFVLKFSTLLLWHRIFPASRCLTVALWILGVIVTAYSAALMYVFSVQCRPLSKFWLGGTCGSVGAVSVTCAALNIATDLGIVVLPIFELRKLNTILKRKVQLALMFALGGIVVGITAARLAEFSRGFPETDTWRLSKYVVLSALECAIATLAANLPVAKPVFVSIARRYQHWADSFSGTRSDGTFESTHNAWRTWPVDTRIPREGREPPEAVPKPSKIRTSRYGPHVPLVNISEQLPALAD